MLCHLVSVFCGTNQTDVKRNKQQHVVKIQFSATAWTRAFLASPQPHSWSSLSAWLSVLFIARHCSKCLAEFTPDALMWTYWLPAFIIHSCCRPINTQAFYVTTRTTNTCKGVRFGSLLWLKSFVCQKFLSMASNNFLSWKLLGVWVFVCV